ncbi:serine kinase [Oscillatoria sp. FACHB-1407]|uniref:serine kinase n=1 Tax=Oscillatoria sp. FACHB-1407 TaxID=2692847 RepID=UPI0016892C7B|nr:serine kinase [Oscillatoria sp. FACHB-1407]MBD2459420.1 serine kinase [Oscillatoria sp. FACHB-1407]
MNTDKIPTAEVLAKANPPEFFDQIYASFQQAAVHVGETVERFYKLAGFTIRLRFAGHALVSPLTSALAHLPQSTEKPDLTICIWDSTSTQTPIPPPPWQGGQLQQRGEILGFNTDRFLTAFQWGSNALSLLDLQENLGIFWVNNAQLLPYWESGSPLRTILHSWLSQRQVQMVHAGAVGLSTGGVLLVGKGGSGKSTTALCCLDSDLLYAGDDYVAITPQPAPQVYSLYNTGKKRANDIDRLPSLKPIITNQERLETEKALYFLYEHFPERIIAGFPLKAILIPRITGGLDTSLTPVSMVTALTALVPSTIKQLPNAGQAACHLITQVVQMTPCYSLNLGTDLQQIPRVILTLLEDIHGSESTAC